MFDARAVLGIVLYFKEKVLKPLRKDGYLFRCYVPKTESITFVMLLFFIMDKYLEPATDGFPGQQRRARPR